MHHKLASLLCLAVVLSLAGNGFAAVVLDESVGGDVSGDPQAPTPLNLALGTNSFLATMPADDVDFITVNVPAGGQLSGLIMAGYSGIDEISFIAVGAGTQMPVEALTNYDPTGLLGYTHFGPGSFDLGTDMLPILGGGNFGVPGFDIPLPSGNYTFWMQQESSTDTGYQLDFMVTAVAEPASAVLLVLASFFFGVAPRRRV
jgi:hypothetical protein